MFQRYRDLSEQIETFTDEAKTYAKQYRCNLNGESLFVKFSPAFKRWHEVGLLKSSMNADEKAAAKAMGLFVTREEVDDKVLKVLLKAGKIRLKIVKAAYKEEEIQSRAEIKEKNT